MDDVRLQRERESACQTPAQPRAGVETFAMFGRVEPLPLQPQVVLEPGAVKQPLQPRLVGAIEGERLALNRRQQSMGTGAVGPGRRAGAGRVERAEDERRAPALDRQRQHRPHQLECRVAAEALVGEHAGGERDAVAQLDARFTARGGAEDRLPFARTGCGTRCCRRRRSRPRQPRAPVARAPVRPASRRTR